MAVANDAMSKTRTKTSRCRVVIPDDSIDESFAIRPLDEERIGRGQRCLAKLEAFRTYKTVLSPV